VVIGVAHEEQIDALRRQAGIVGRSRDDLDVAETLVARTRSQVVDHVGVDVDGVDDAVRADDLREPEREVPAARADVGDALAFADADRLEDAVGLLPAVASPAFVGEALPGSAAERREEGAREERRGHGVHLWDLLSSRGGWLDRQATERRASDIPTR